jgi:hypothetical protein
MRHLSTAILALVTAIFACCINSFAGADILVSYQPDTDASGYYSDALGSGGYFYEQTIATQFSLAQDASLTQLTFWGSSENFVFGDLTNMTAFEVNILSSDLSSLVASYTLGDVTLTPTGNLNPLGGVEYGITSALSGSLAAGTYWLNVGAMLASGDGDAFVWTTSAAAPPSLRANFFDGGGWYDFDGFSGTAFELHGTAPVPGPGALALLACAAIVGRRRRS